jgi:hypothetical protein
MQEIGEYLAGAKPCILLKIQALTTGVVNTLKHLSRVKSTRYEPILAGHRYMLTNTWLPKIS